MLMHMFFYIGDEAHMDFKHFIHNVYRPHLEKIMKKYGIENPKIALRFNELLQYIEKRNSK